MGMARGVDPRDPVLDTGRVLDLVRRHLPSARTLTEIDESGGEARTYFIDDQYVFKTQRPHRVRPRTSLEKEAFHLQQLAALKLSTPRPLGYGREEDVEYILMTRMPGAAMRHLKVEGPARSAVLRELGSLLKQIHALPLEPLRASGLFPGDNDSAETQQRLEHDLARAVEAASALHSSWTLEISPADVAARVRTGAGIVEDAPVALHSNPGTEHVFLDPMTLRLTGIIDFGDAYISHPALDMRRWGSVEDRDALIGGYTADAPVSETFAAKWRLISVAHLMLDFAQRPGRRAESLAGLRLLLDQSTGSTRRGG